MSKKVDVAGETYIVSEDVDFDQLDTETLVEKENLAELLTSAQVASDALQKSISTNRKAVEKKLSGRPILEFHLKFAKKHYVFTGEIFWAESLETTASYKLIMKNTDAFLLYNLVLKTQGKVGATTKKILFIKSIMHGTNGELIEFIPPKGKNGITAQKLDRVKVSPKNSLKSGSYSYVEIDFASIHWR